MLKNICNKAYIQVNSYFYMSMNARQLFLQRIIQLNFTTKKIPNLYLYCYFCSGRKLSTTFFWRNAVILTVHGRTKFVPVTQIQLPWERHYIYSIFRFWRNKFVICQTIVDSISKISIWKATLASLPSQHVQFYDMTTYFVFFSIIERSDLIINIKWKFLN